MNTTYFLNQVMGNLFHTKEDPGLPKRYYMGLSATEPGVDGSGVTEPTGNGYARVLLNGLLSAPVKGVIKNSGAISFNESIGNWGVVTHYVVYDAAAGGNLLFFGDLSLSRNVEQNTVITVKTGELVISLEPPEASA